jgi:hypothetical protein
VKERESEIVKRNLHGRMVASFSTGTSGASSTFFYPLSFFSSRFCFKYLSCKGGIIYCPPCEGCGEDSEKVIIYMCHNPDENYSRFSSCCQLFLVYSRSCGNPVGKSNFFRYARAKNNLTCSEDEITSPFSAYINLLLMNNNKFKKI